MVAKGIAVCDASDQSYLESLKASNFSVDVFFLRSQIFF
jgi:hypothetical protein